MSKINCLRTLYNKLTGNTSSGKSICDVLDEINNNLPTRANGKYLHTNATTGALEWADAGGGSTSHLYQHNIVLHSNNAYSINISIFNDSDTEFTTLSLSTYLEAYPDEVFPSTGCYYNTNQWEAVTGIFYNSDEEVEDTMVRHFDSDSDANDSPSTLTVVSDNVITLI